MARLTINVKESKLQQLLDYLQKLDYVKVEKQEEDGFDELSLEVKQEIEESIAEHEQGKSIKHDDLFKELRQDLRA